MADFDRKKIISNKSRNYARDGSSGGGGGGRNFSGRSQGTLNVNSKDKEPSSSDLKQPTILLKNRDSNVEEASGNAKKKPKEADNVGASHTVKENEVIPPTLKYMRKSLKLIEDGSINIEHLQEYMQENSDFIVVGVVGSQGVGKSTILNLLTEKKVTNTTKKNLFPTFNEPDSGNGVTILTKKIDDFHLDEANVFKIQPQEDIENCLNTTQGIDIYVSANRVIFLDCQPFLSVSVLDDLIESENKRTNLVSEFIPLENSGEIQGLQYTAFLMSVCHILLVVQDWFFDSNVVRFIQTAEMLKPTISNNDDEYSEHFPHLIMVQNKAQMADFTPKQFKIMQKVYSTLFQKTKLQFHTNLGLGSGRIINTLDPENCGNPANLFLIPEQGVESETHVYCGHPPLEDLIKKLRANLFGATKNPLTHIQLTEKTWLAYCNKVWDTVKKSPFFVEYTKLMP